MELAGQRAPSACPSPPCAQRPTWMYCDRLAQRPWGYLRINIPWALSGDPSRQPAAWLSQLVHPRLCAHRRAVTKPSPESSPAQTPGVASSGCRAVLGWMVNLSSTGVSPLPSNPRGPPPCVVCIPGSAYVRRLDPRRSTPGTHSVRHGCVAAVNCREARFSQVNAMAKTVARSVRAIIQTPWHVRMQPSMHTAVQARCRPTPRVICHSTTAPARFVN